MPGGGGQHLGHCGVAVGAKLGHFHPDNPQLGKQGAPRAFDGCGGFQCAFEVVDKEQYELLDKSGPM
jgi:hypothetical protein